jgi:hypothetical protein
VGEVYNSIQSILLISGEGSNHEGEERILPIFIYIVIMAAPEKMLTSIKYLLVYNVFSIINTLYNKEGKTSQNINYYN